MVMSDLQLVAEAREHWCEPEVITLEVQEGNA